jgi:endonuclease/exonuclease/phosphatase (EEP) superfamily protein YafD
MRRRLLTVLGACALIVAAVALAVRYVPIVNRPLIATAALAPYLMLGAPVAVLLFAALRRWLVAMLAAALTVGVVAVQLPWHVASEPGDGVPVRFMSANLRYGHGDPATVVRLARENADIVAVQELTPVEADRLSAAGMDATFPHRALQAREGPAGVGIWSRYPIAGGELVDGFWLGLLTTQVQIPGVSGETTVVTTHMSAPWPDPLQGWRDDMARLAVTLESIASSATGPVLVGGDLNATPDIREFRRLLRDGYQDAAAQAGAGLTRTHPADLGPLPPVFAVDHILTRQCTARTVRTLSVPASDHRALVANLACANPSTAG